MDLDIIGEIAENVDVVKHLGDLSNKKCNSDDLIA